MKKLKRPQLFKIINSFEVDPMYFAETLGEDIHFRIEILQNLSNKKHHVRLWRYEFFNLAPTFPPGGLSNKWQGGVLILVEDHFVGTEEIKTDTAAGALQLALRLILIKFGKPDKKIKRIEGALKN